MLSFPGGNHDKSERFIDFTVLTGVSGEDGIMQEEIFGPLLPVVNVKSPEDAVTFINEREKPLALYVFTADSRVQKLFTERTSSGGLCINDCIMHVVVETLPFGGVGHSGMGAYHGKVLYHTPTIVGLIHVH
jgi:acyl-CoA reductase-like NAD-dependent aldehyde dehydrogenase